MQKKRADTDVPKGKTSPPPALRRFGKRERRTETCALTKITGSSSGHWRLPTETRRLAFNNTERRGGRRMYTCRLYFGKEEREDFAGIPAVEPRKDEQAEDCLCCALFPCARPVDIQPCKSEPCPPAAREWCPPSRRRPLLLRGDFIRGNFDVSVCRLFCGSPWRGRGLSKGEEEARQVSCIRVCGSTSSTGAVVQAIAELGVENRWRAFQYWGERTRALFRAAGQPSSAGGRRKAVGRGAPGDRGPSRRRRSGAVPPSAPPTGIKRELPLGSSLFLAVYVALVSLLGLVHLLQV